MRVARLPILAALAAGCLIGKHAASAGPVQNAWTVAGPDDTVAIAGAALSGVVAAADSYEDAVEVRDLRGTLLKVITRSDITALLPWMSLAGGPDGPSGLAWSDSGRVLFILVHDAAIPGDGLGSDAVLRYDMSTDTLNVFARLELYNTDSGWPHLAAAFFKGRLYVGTSASGVAAYAAPSTGTTGTLLGTYALPGGTFVRGLAIDRDNATLYASTDAAIYRTSTASLPPSFALVGPLSDIRGIAFGDHYGGPANRGVYVLRTPAGGTPARIDFVPALQASGGAGFSPTLYTTFATEAHDIAATADGTLLVATDEDAILLSDTTDAWLPYDGWVADEVQQVVTFSKGLISPDGEPTGWVIDGDVTPGGTRFHPATPDAAAWVVCMLLVNDRLTGDPTARGLVRQILMRYAGLAPSGPAPSRTPDGQFRHWINPANGGVKPGWDPEYATLSTMLIVAAAARAADFYPTDPDIARAASRIIFQVHNWDAYVQGGTDALYLKALAAGGPDPSVVVRPFFEGIMFAEQAAAYGGAPSDSAYARWLTRSLWPNASYLPGRSITSTGFGVFESSFISLYPLLLQRDFRTSSAWQTQIQNIRWSAGAWTDDSGPRYFTIFSAGTTRSDWGGYHADSLGSHPGNLTTFTSLEALGGAYVQNELAGAYAAYRKGARQTFKCGASILYRQSDIDRTYVPNSAGIPDVVLGGIGLAEAIQPGIIDSILARPYPALPPCAADWDRSGSVTPADLAAFVSAWFLAFSTGDLATDASGNHVLEPADIAVFVNTWFAALAGGC